MSLFKRIFGLLPLLLLAKCIMDMYLSRGSFHAYFMSWIDVVAALRGSNGVCSIVVTFVLDGKGGEIEQVWSLGRD